MCTLYPGGYINKDKDLALEEEQKQMKSTLEMTSLAYLLTFVIVILFLKVKLFCLSPAKTKMG